MEDEVTYLCGELGREGCDNVVEFGLLLRNPPGSELCLHLGEPHVRVGGPKGRELQVDRRVSDWRCGCRCVSVIVDGHGCRGERRSCVLLCCDHVVVTNVGDLLD